MDEWKRSGQIPAFGDWERANEMPITQYFESARQAGLIRFTKSSGEEECDNNYMPCDFNKPIHLHHNHYNNLVPPRKAKVSTKKKDMETHVKEQKKQLQRNVIEPSKKHHHHRQHQQNYYNNGYGGNKDNNNNAYVIPPRPRYPKPVDEDLYKIPPQLLRKSKRKKVPGFFSCLVPACAS